MSGSQVNSNQGNSSAMNDTQINVGELRGPDGDGSTMAIIAGVVGAAAGFLLGAMVVLFVCRAQRRKRESSRRESTAQQMPSDAELERPAAPGNSDYMAVPQPQPITPSASSSTSTSGYDRVPVNEKPSAVSSGSVLVSAYGKAPSAPPPVTYSQIPADRE
jgi:hypothetical protein